MGQQAPHRYPGKSRYLCGGRCPRKRGKDRKLCRPPYGAIVYPYKAGQTPLLRPRPGISPSHGHMAHRNSIAPGPGGLSAPALLAGTPAPYSWPPARGRVSYGGGVWWSIYRGPVAWGRAAGAGCIHGPGRYISLSRCRELCRGAAPMGAGLVPSTGAAGVVKMGFISPFPGAFPGGITPPGDSNYSDPLYTNQIEFKIPKYGQKMR